MRQFYAAHRAGVSYESKATWSLPGLPDWPLEGIVKVVLSCGCFARWSCVKLGHHVDCLLYWSHCIMACFIYWLQQLVHQDSQQQLYTFPACLLAWTSIQHHQHACTNMLRGLCASSRMLAGIGMIGEVSSFAHEDYQHLLCYANEKRHGHFNGGSLNNWQHLQVGSIVDRCFLSLACLVCLLPVKAGWCVTGMCDVSRATMHQWQQDHILTEFVCSSCLPY